MNLLERLLILIFSGLFIFLIINYCFKMSKRLRNPDYIPKDKLVFIPKIIHNILFFSKEKPVYRLGVFYQLVVLWPIIILNIWLMVALFRVEIFSDLKLQSRISIPYMFFTQFLYVNISGFLFSLLRNRVEILDKTVVGFRENLPIKEYLLYLLFIFVVFPFINGSGDDFFSFKIMLMIIFSLFVFETKRVLESKILPKYLLKSESLIVIGGFEIKYKDINKVEKSIEPSFYGFMEKDCAKIEFKKKSKYNICPCNVELFISELKNRCPNADFVLDSDEEAGQFYGNEVPDTRNNDNLSDTKEHTLLELKKK